MKQPICKVCKEPFERKYSSTQQVCSIKCGIQRARDDGDNIARRAINLQQKAQRAAHRKRKEALRPKSYYVKQAQAAFNAYIRKRDEGSVCISCQKPPKKINCGHYKTTKARPDIRFHQFNGNIQCEHCNTWKSGAIDLYRPNLIKKIGEKNVEWLESEQPMQNLTQDDLIEIKEYYKEQLKLLKDTA